MDRKEAVQILSEKAKISVSYAEDLYDSFFPKPVVPQFVADWLKNNDWREDTSGTQTIFDVFDNLTLDASNGYYKDVKEWVKSNGNILAQAWVNGYEVEEEPRYRVRFKGVSNTHTCLVVNQFRNFWSIEEDVFGSENTAHTRKELEANGFGWVFDCPGVEVKEVTDE